ncbi:FUSC family protein [Mycobacterium helveticum]|uniref:FUSC family protein n=1 Tax=Mycobacterium helveticum TaxID=2592811 RepID=A0A557XF83_9MYCO|nr:FUSC family protein [Mycobacterium helveticum]TVS84253.1 FUSC family protein [Mycobacterium helveticum]TVS85631.1 FUSC family protein [Mycobacterium helveticum]
MASRTTAALACSLVVLFLLTRATGQPLTVALLGVVITMVASRSVDEPDPRRQRITMGLLPVPAALAIAAAALLAPHRVAGDAAFVVVVFGAVYVRRFGARGRALGMVAFMSYFFSLYLRARIAELPWMIGAVAVGTVCTYVIGTYVLPDRPERVLRATVRALRARMAIVVDTTADAVRTGRFDERRRRRMRARTIRLNETALLVQSQIEDKAEPAMRWLGVAGGQLAPWLFDAELAIEWVATAGRKAADVSTEIPGPTRDELVGTLTQLARAIRSPQSDGLRGAGERAQRLLDRRPVPAGASGTPGPAGAADAAVRRLALAIANAANASAEVRAIVERAAAGGAPAPESGGPEAAAPDAAARSGLRPTTRQAIQVSVAASLAIVTGELVSPLRWYWAVIAAFVIFAGTSSWGETLTKGWQRVLGTVLGVPCGMLVATLASGDTVVSVVLIFVCLFCAFYFMTVTYSLMIFWITTMLALLYGLLGEFSVDVLLLRIEETAIGAVIGVGVAILVLPTNTRTAIRDDARAFLTTLSELIEASAATMCGAAAVRPTERARRLDRDLQQFRTTSKPLLVGVAGFAGRRSIRRALQLFTACDHFGRSLARSAAQVAAPDGSPAPAAVLVAALASAAAQTRRNIDALIAVLDGARAATIVSATEALDTTLAGQRDAGSPPRPDTRRFLTAVHSLRQIERLVATLAADLGAGDGAPG